MATSLALGLEPRQCQVCHARAGLQRCSGCQAVFYCGREHQVNHRESHKRACTTVRKALTALSREEQKLRSRQQGGSFAGADLFEEQAGHFWGILETRDYMQARYAVVERTLDHFGNEDAVRSSLDHVTDMLRLCRSDNLGVRDIAPALYLRLGRDQECYDFLKWWATTGEEGDYDWGDMDEPYLDVEGADVLESPEGLWTGGWIQLGHAASVALIKVRVLLDLQHMQNATRAFEGAAPREIIDEIRGGELVSGVVASRKDIVQASAERTAELVGLVKGQVKMLFDTIARYNPAFWRMLLDPRSRPARRPDSYSPRSEEEAALIVMYSYEAWRETPGSIEVMRKLRDAA